jgi:hypothetical protein
VKEDEMDRVCSTNVRDEEYMQGFGGKTRRLDVGERIILKWILQKQDGGMDWINLA